MKRRKQALALAALVCLTGCAAAFPETAKIIAPATLDEFWLGMLIDLEGLWGWLALLGV